MSRTFRWQIWLLRLLLVVVVLLAAQYGLGLATRSIVIHSGDVATGGQIDVAHARVSLIDRQLVLSDVRVANSADSLTNLIEADRCEFDFAAGPMLHKQAVIETGVISGLRFDTPRDDSGAIADRSPSQIGRSLQWFNDEYPDRAQDWMEHLNRRFDPELIKQSQAIQRTVALRERLPQQSADLVRRARTLTQRTEALQTELEAALANQLRHVEYLKAVPNKISALRRDYDALAAEVERLPELVDADRREIIAARRQDEVWLREQLNMPPIDAAVLTAYLLREQVRQPLEHMIGWLRFARELVPAEHSEPSTVGKRGEEIYFAGCQRAPGLLVRALALHGTGRVGGQPIELRGTLSDFASTPARHTQPMQLRLTTAGSLPLVLQATIDRTGAAAADELLVDCHGIVLPKSGLGESDRFRLELAPTVGELSISIHLEGEKLTGDIQLVQTQVQISSRVGGDLSDVPLVAALDDKLRDVNALATRLSLSGTLDEPKCELRSNLGPTVAQALDGALRRTADQHARKMLADVQRQVDEQLTLLERQLAEDRAELLPQLSQAASQLEKIAAQQKSPPRITPEQLGRRLPGNSLFR